MRAMRTLSARLLDTERAQAQANRSVDITDAAERALVHLGERFVGIIGTDGYRALVARALRLASRDYPLLNDVRPGIHPPGRLVGLADVSHEDVTQVRTAAAATLAALLWLLVQFVGNDLTTYFAREVWPTFSVSDSARRDQQRMTG